MLALNQTLDQVCSLLKQLPGVTLLRSGLGAGIANIEITHTVEATVDDLQRVTEGANVAIEPWLPAFGTAGSIRLPAKQTLIARTDPRDSIEFGDLQLLGIHIAWHLHKAGLLTTARANNLLRQWHGATVGA